jgi:hypothetical protein
MPDRDQASRVMAMMIPASTNTTIRAWVQKKIRGISLSSY